MKQHGQDQQSGSIVVTILFIMMFLSTILFGLLLLANANLTRAYQRVFLLEAQYAAESGADMALAELNASVSYTGTTSDITVVTNSSYKATFATTVAAGSSGSQKIITSTGKIYKPATATTATYSRKIQVTISQTAGSTAVGLMSRNIIDVDSSVKNIQTKGVYVNGFINLRSNSTNMLFETITAAGKDTGASNCSIEGSGHLLRASTLAVGVNPIIDVRYNNCISPPGNTTNANFTVSANDNTVSTISSTYVPWSYYMDNSYQSAPQGCNDWTAAGSTLTIPSTGNTKKTHYPDSSSGVASTCGTSGNLSLGSKLINIADNVHVRANFCATSACDPTFNNTSGSIKYVFIEGTINFNTIHTCPYSGTCASTSSPIVFITYGADPGTHAANKCPYGDSIYLNKSGSTGTAAPAAYLLATNSVCLDQTKFDANPALGGLGGKNLYIASNSGNPFDLYLDPTFPVTSIPINLTWKATGYERL